MLHVVWASVDLHTIWSHVHGDMHVTIVNAVLETTSNSVDGLQQGLELADHGICPGLPATTLHGCSNAIYGPGPSTSTLSCESPCASRDGTCVHMWCMRGIRA
jgi:hypothetical protein